MKSIYDRVIGKSPRLNFDPDGGIELHVFNTRDETIIIERIEASPPLDEKSVGYRFRYARLRPDCGILVRSQLQRRERPTWH